MVSGRWVWPRSSNRHRPFGNTTLTRSRTVRRLQTGIPGDVAWYAYACSQCGYCIDECDQFYGRAGESVAPRQVVWLREYLEGRVDWTRRWSTRSCVYHLRALQSPCSAALPSTKLDELRGTHPRGQKDDLPPFEMMAAATVARQYLAGYRKDRTRWLPRR